MIRHHIMIRDPIKIVKLTKFIFLIKIIVFIPINFNTFHSFRIIKIISCIHICQPYQVTTENISAWCILFEDLNYDLVYTLFEITE